MRSEKSVLVVCILLIAIPSWGKQAPQSASATQPTSDPQAVAVVQAAITTLGGATAISQAQRWTFQAQMQGPRANGDTTYALSTDTDTGKLVAADGSTKPAHPIHSHFVPALVASILVKELQDPKFRFFYEGAGTRDSKPVTVIRVMLSDGGMSFPAQFWSFDSINLPVQADFRLPAEIGARQSFPVVVGLSDYRAVSGVLYPFGITTFLPGGLPQTVTLKSIVVEATTPPNEFNGNGGDLR
jgi:hypothetical protein